MPGSAGTRVTREDIDTEDRQGLPCIKNKHMAWDTGPRGFSLMLTHRGSVSSVPRSDCSVTFPLTFRAHLWLLQCSPLQSFSKTSSFSSLCLEELCPLKWILGEEDKGIGVCCPGKGTQWYVGFSSVGYLLPEACYQVT